MKKIIKYFSLFVFALTVAFSQNFIVKADGACGNEDSSHCRETNNRKIIVGGNNWKYKPFEYATHAERSEKPHLKYSKVGIVSHGSGTSLSFNYYNESQSAIFCLDVQNSGEEDLAAERFLIDSENGERVNYFDAAIINILTSNGIIKKADPNSGNIEDYLARLMAVRGIGYVFEFNTQKGPYMGDFKLWMSTAGEWFSDERVINSFNKLSNTLVSHGKSALSKPKVYKGYYFSGDNADNIKESAKQYFVNALDAANNYILGLDVTKQSYFKKGEFSLKNESETGSNDNTLITKEYQLEIKAKGLDNLVINGIKFKDNKIPAGVAYDVSIVSGALGTNLMQNVADKSKESTFIINITFSGLKNNLKCSEHPFEFYVDGYYTDSSLGEYDKYVGTIWYSGKTNQQRFVGIEEASNTNNSNIKKTINIPLQASLIDGCSCDDLRDQCQAGNQESCTELSQNEACVCIWLDYVCDYGSASECSSLHSQYDDTCSNCETVMNGNDVCCKDDQLLVSNNPNDYNTVEIIGVGANEVKACFVSKIDQQVKATTDSTGNVSSSYVEGIADQKNNSFKLMQNKYCVVSCEEDYQLYLPTAKLANAGRYFTFNAKIVGQKACFTNTINKQQFDKDMLELQKEWIDAYNTYVLYTEALKDENIKTSSGNCNSSCVNSDTNGSTYTNYYVDIKVNKGIAYSVGQDGHLTITRTTAPLSYSSGSLGYGTSGNGYCEHVVCATISSLDVDTDGDGVCDYNCDTNGDGKPNVNIDVNGDRSCDYNCDANNDGIPDTSLLNQDSNGDGKCDLNCDVNGDGIPDGNSPDAKACDPNELICTCTSACQSGSRANLVNHIKSMISSAQSTMSTLAGRYQEYINEFKSCSGNWTNADLNYNPQVRYDYEEDYMNLKDPMIGIMTTANAPTSASYVNYDNSINDFYTSSDGYSGASKTQVERYVVCDTSGCRYSSQNIPIAKYRKSVSTVDAVYRPMAVFYNNYATGDIYTKYDDEYDEKNSVSLGPLLPVKRNSTGVRDYSVLISNLGEIYNTSTLGRYFGGSSVFGINTFVYDCSYLVNIVIESLTQPLVCYPDCIDCDDPCIGPNCGCMQDCLAECVGVGCLYDEDYGKTFADKTVSLNNMFPNPDSLKYYNWTNDKGRYTRLMIENKSFTTSGFVGIPDNTVVTGDGANDIYHTTPELSITLTPEARRLIKEYNNSARDSGGYINKTLTCESIGSYQKIACYSNFITDLLNNKITINDTSYNIDIVNKSNSKISNQQYRNNPNNYFTLWPGEISEEKMLGPSWK